MKMNIKKILVLLAILSLFVFASCRSEGNDPEVNPADLVEKKHDTALLLVTFGSTYDLPKDTYKKQEEFFKKRYPNVDLYVSYTSRTIINRMQAKGETFLPPQVWLKSFLKKQYKDVYVQSLHVIPGEEYTLLRDAYVNKEYNVHIEDLNNGQNKAILGEPLLSGEASIKRVAEVLIDDFADALKKGEVVAFMGHGNPNNKTYFDGNAKYDQIEKYMQEYALQKYGNAKVFVGTVDYPGKLFDDYLADAVEHCGASEKIIHLQPLMTIAGDHASNDMAGDDVEEDGQPIPMEERSWKLQLENMGWKVHTYMKGLGDYEEINQVFYDHLQVAIKESAKSGE